MDGTTSTISRRNHNSNLQFSALLSALTGRSLHPICRTTDPHHHRLRMRLLQGLFSLILHLQTWTRHSCRFDLGLLHMCQRLLRVSTTTTAQLLMPTRTKRRFLPTMELLFVAEVSTQVQPLLPTTECLCLQAWSLGLTRKLLKS